MADVDDVLTRFWSDLVGRVHGPLSFRFVLQPLMALVFATRDGIVDARQERDPYFWTIFTRPGERWDLLREGGRAVTRVMALGVLMDVVYQLLTFHRIYTAQLIVIVLALAFLPYVVFRGPINRIAKAWMTRKVRS